MIPQDNVLTLERLLGLSPNQSEPASNKGFELLFDSAIHSAAAGIRTSVVSARQLLFRIGAIFVDVEIGRETSSDQVSLIGQMIDSSNPGQPPAGILITLLHRGRDVAATSTNDHGEFQFQFRRKDHLKLVVAFDRRNPVYLPIPCFATKPNAVLLGTKRVTTRPLQDVVRRRAAEVA